MLNINDFVQKLDGMLASRDDFTALSVGGESLDGVSKEVYATQESKLKTNIEVAFQDINRSGEPIDATKTEVAILAAKESIDPVKRLASLSKAPEAVDGAIVAGDPSLDVIPADKVSVGIENFDREDLSKSMLFGIVYHTIATQQDPVIELFYPLIPTDSDKKAFTLSIRVTSIMKTVTRNRNGDPVKFDKKPILKNLGDDDLFGADVNKLVPIYTTDGANKFLDVPGSKRVVTIGSGEKVTTAPLKVGTEIDLAGISQSDELVAKGLMDETDSLTGVLNVEALYLEVKGQDANGNDVTEYFREDISAAPVTFIPTGTGDSRDLDIEDGSVVVKLTAGQLVNLAGSSTAIKAFTDLPSGTVVNVRLKVKGDANADTCGIQVYGISAELDSVVTSTGIELPADDEKVVAVKDVIDNTSIVAYDVEAYGANKNLRFQPQQLVDNTYTFQYRVPVKTKAMEKTPVVDNSELGSLLGQVSVTQIALTKEGVKALTTAVDSINAISSANKPVSPSGYMFNSYAIKDSFSINDILNSIESSKKEGDVKTALKLKIRDYAIAMNKASGYRRVFRTVFNGQKPTVIVGVGENLASYVEGFSDELFNYKVEISDEKTLANKIFLSFGDFSGKRNKEPSVFGFGFTGYVVTPTFTVTRSSGGSIVNESFVLGAYKHFRTLDVLVDVTVSGLESIADATVIGMRQV